MATKFQIKRSSVSGRTPNTTNAANSSYIAAGELALNLTDKKMYSSNGTNYFEIGSFKVEQTNSTSNVSTFTEISTLQFDEDSGFAVTSPSTGVAKIAINSTFKFWQVDGVQKLTAAGLDTVNFIGGNNISITANGANTPQSIAFATSMTPTFTSVTFGNSTVNTTINSSSIAVTKIFANGVTGSAGQVLSANSTGGIYWETSAGGAGTLTVTSDTFNGNGSNTIFTLSTSSTTDRSFVYLNGVQQAPTTDYTISGTTLTFVVAPPSDNVIEVRSFDIPSIADITVTTDTFTANGTQTNFTLSTPDSSVTNSLVFLNGVTQVPTTDYTLSTTTLTFLSAPVNGTAVQAISFTSAGVKSAAFTGNGSNTQFTLPVISTTSKTIVAINGVTQTPVTDYSVSGTTLIFAVAPVNNDNILVRVLPSKVDSAGGNTQIQYNKSGSLGGSAGFTFNDTTNNVVVGNTLTVPNFILNASNPPANSTSTGTTGTFAWDSSFFYVATGTNTWKKVPITTDGAGGGSPGGSNTHIQYNDSNTFNGSAAFTFNESTNTVTLSNTLAIGSNVTVNTSTIFIGNSSVNTTITAGNVHLQGTQLTVGNVVLTGEQLTVGNSTVNSVIRANGATFSGHLMPSANVTYDIGNSAMRWRDLWLSGTTINLGGATIKTDTDTGAIAFVPKATADVPNPKAVVVSPRGGIQAVDTTDGVPVINNSITVVDGISYGNSTVNTTINSTSVSTVVLNVGSNVFVNTSTIHLGNSTVNTVIHTTGFTGNGAGLHSVNAAALEGNTVANILTAANTAANTLANAAYSNAVSYAASNTYVNNTFLPLAGGTLTGAITVGNSTVNSVVNSTSASLGNTTITGFVNVSSNLTVTSVAAFGNNVTITGNLIVTGTRIFANTTTVDLSDNIITLNADIGAGVPSENAGLEVHRGTSANVQFVWNETIDKWTFTTDGTNYVTVASNNDVTTAYSNAIAYSGNAALAYANAIAYAASNSYVNSTFAPLSGATFTGAVSGITTLAAGNTTITGFANVSTTLQVGTNTATFGTALYVVANGGVGIGTASPATKLEVTGDITQTWAASMDRFVGSKFSTTYELGLHFIEATRETRIVSKAADSTGFISFYTGVTPTVRAVIDSSGNLGIGNTAPNARLHVTQSTTTAASLTWGAAAGQIFRNEDSELAFGLSSSSPYPIYLQARTNASAVRQIALNPLGGNVGIGTLDPTISSGSGLHINSGSGHGGLKLQSTGRTFELLSTSGGYFTVYDTTGGADRLSIAANGNVGVGTTSPGYKLDVNGTTSVGYLRVAPQDGSSEGGEIQLVGASSYGTLQIDNFQGNARIHTLASGKVFQVIGGTLDVTGTGGSSSFAANVNVTGTLSCTTLTETSSITFKENVNPISNALDNITKLVGVTYDRKDGSAKQKAGLIAEEVEQVLPNVVQKDNDGNPSSIAYTNLIAYLIESIKELKQEIDILKGK